MSNQKLYIEGYEVPYTNLIALSKKSIDITDLSTQTLNYSQNVSVQRTQLTAKIFSDAGQNNSADTFNKYYSYHVSQSGQIVFKGLAILKEKTVLSFKVQLLDLAKDFFDSLTEKMSVLDFSVDDFLFTDANYVTLSLPTTSCWVWPVVCNHEDATTANTVLNNTADIRLLYSRPSFNVSVLYDEIFTSKGWIVEDTDTTLLDQLCITSNHEKFNVCNYSKTYTSTSFVSAGTLILTGFNTFDYSFDPPSQTGLTAAIYSEDDSISIVINGNITSTADVKLGIRRVFTGGLTGDRVVIQLRAGTFDYNINTKPLKTSSVGSVDSVELELLDAGTVTFNSVILHTVIEEQEVRFFDGVSTIHGINTNPCLGRQVRYEDNSPAITQLAFLKQLWSMTGAYIDVDNLNKKVTVKHLNRASTVNSSDWSGKFVQLSEEVIKPLFLAQTNYFNYTNDELTTLNLAQSAIVTEDETTVSEQDYITNIWGASDEVQLQNSALTKTFLIGDMPVYATQADRLNTANPRVLQYEQPSGESYTIANLNDLEYDELITDYYSLLVTAFDKPEFLKGVFNLKDVDFFRLDFEKPVFINSLGGTYLLLEVSNYIQNKLTECTLLKIL